MLVRKFGQTLILVLSFTAFVNSFAQSTLSDDKEWTKQMVVIKNSGEADFIVRIGDVDNLGFNWPEGFDPFCGRMTEAHFYPWNPETADVVGMDRILLSSKYNPEDPKGCGGDGYSGSYDPVFTKPASFTIPVTALKGVEIKNAFLQIFIDDFQSPSFCSRYHVWLNNRRFAEAEKIINAIDQTGPVGKLINIPIPEEFYDTLSNSIDMSLFIDEVVGVPDGFAIDFVRLLINRKRENACKGTIRGYVFVKDTQDPIANARVSLADNSSVLTGKDGSFTIKEIYTGFEVLTASSSGYKDGSATADVGTGDDNPEVFIYLEKAGEVLFDKKSIKVGEAINLNNILFDQGKAELRVESKAELDKVIEFLEMNPAAEIELSGHTSSEGEAAFNRSLSYKRVKSCKDFIVGKGIDAGRIIVIGYGPDRPIAPNDSETNRAKNRRVEMRVVKL